MKQLVIIAVILMVSIPVKSQADYKNAIGVRAAPSAGLTYRTFLSDRSAMEFMLSSRWRGLNLTALYERNQVAFSHDQWNFYYGVGGHVGFWDAEPEHPWFDEHQSYVVLGVDGIIGLEYTFESIPFNLSVDWKPAFNIASYTGFWIDEIGFSVRYVIN